MTAGSVHIVVNDPPPASPGYVLISTTPRVFYVAADLNQSAVANDVFALGARDQSAFTIGALAPNDNTHTVDPANFPIQTGASIVSATVDTMTVTFTDFLPGSVTENQNKRPVAKTERQGVQQHRHLAATGCPAHGRQSGRRRRRAREPLEGHQRQQPL